jgi:hypothetical protein
MTSCVCNHLAGILLGQGGFSWPSQEPLVDCASCVGNKRSLNVRQFLGTHAQYTQNHKNARNFFQKGLEKHCLV